jgi:hypothetical protein
MVWLVACLIEKRIPRAEEIERGKALSIRDWLDKTRDIEEILIRFSRGEFDKER